MKGQAMTNFLADHATLGATPLYEEISEKVFGSNLATKEPI